MAEQNYVPHAKQYSTGPCAWPWPRSVPLMLISGIFHLKKHDILLSTNPGMSI